MKNNETAEWLQREANNGWTSGYSHITGAGGEWEPATVTFTV